MESTMVRWFAFLAVAVMIATAAAAASTTPEAGAGSGVAAELQAGGCNPSALSPCLPAITSSAPPSAQCCGQLRQQKPCLCGYLRNPSFRQYLNTPGAKRVASACKVPLPSC